MINFLKFSLTVLFFLLNIGFSNPREDKIFIDYKIEEFNFMGREAKVVFPEIPVQERYWIWRARFWGHEPQLDKLLLSKGFHLVYVDVAGLYGSPEAVKIWNKFYQFITTKYNLNHFI